MEGYRPIVGGDGASVPVIVCRLTPFMNFNYLVVRFAVGFGTGWYVFQSWRAATTQPRQSWRTT